MPQVPIDARQHVVGNVRQWAAAHKAAGAAAAATIDASEAQLGVNPSPPREVLLVANDGITAVRVPHGVITTHSTLLKAIVEATEAHDMDQSKSPGTSPVEHQLQASGPSPAEVQAAEDDAKGFNLPGVVPLLELDAATPRALTAFSVWAWRRLTVKPSIIEIPTPSLVELEDLHDDVWDAAYLLQVVSGVEKATQDLQDFRFARECLALAVALGVAPWEDLLSSFIVFQLRRALRLSQGPLEVVQRWLKAPAGSITVASVAEAEAWGAAATERLVPRRQERPVDPHRWEQLLEELDLVNDLDKLVAASQVE
jgi:hypothetical protein